jgi:phosphate transport system permease protein
MSAQAETTLLRPNTRRARRRKVTGRIMEALATAAALLAVAVLAIVLVSVAKRGLPALNVDFFTQNAAPFGQSGGGIANAIVGTLIIIAMALAMAIPTGLLLAIFNVEFAPPSVADAIRLALNVLAGVPTIVIGVFIFSLIVVGRGQSGFAGSVGLAIVMLPLIARGTEEVLLLVPSSLREGSLALGASRTRTVLTVVLPTAIGGMVTATIVAVARAAGETAPLLFTCSIFVSTAITTDPRQPMATLPIVIFTSSESPSAHDQQQAWATALVLIGVVLLGSILGRVLSLRTRRQIERAR